MTATDLGLPLPTRPHEPAPGMPTEGPMVDTHGRAVHDLRVSVTDRCNLRCRYCMPAEGLDWLSRDSTLRADEIVRLVRVGVQRLGIRAVRFTGGEPLLRRDLPEIIAEVAALTPRPEISVTSNGLALGRKAGILAAVGLNRVNVSLDTMDRDRFAHITRRDRLDDVLAGLRAAADAGLTPVKVNAVLSPDGGLDDASALLAFCLTHGYQLRIIEQMPLDAEHGWSRSAMVSADDVLARLSTDFTLIPDEVPRGAAPAETWRVPGFTDAADEPAKVGIIASVTRPFCGDCDRTRLTADGQVRNCLFAEDETDLRDLLRAGANDDELALRWRRSTWLKLPGHAINDPDFLQPRRPMSAIGG
ncbi:GTP 3',8-cyclase MoaA [Williamsia sterculiae]|uniref:GTP 3',8-cyclase n=1 Tax=Williamsia sterculiae TaxID=1344003 RepID=A0A1N7GW14_9NOCA|nr:GTP 3',8-cyclase MoaA [Williamsia sterculiae]SIS16793.1 cyclic pyranopterin monophosphate synthase subunit MoaA [Williamsia sterculiae]